MLKMVLADDESIVREGISNIIDWHEFGIDIVAQASDGQEAYDLCMELSPDILFTDIKMPYLDGIEVASKLKENGNNLKVIIFSGIQDFGYAKSALNVNAEGYLLKPMEVAELTETLNKVIKKINYEHTMATRVIQLRQQLHENFGAAREKFLKDFVSGAYQKGKDIIEKINYFKNPFQISEPMIVAVLQVDDYSRVSENFSEEERQLLNFSITNIVEEIINNHTQGVCVAMAENEYVLLFNHNINENAEEPFYSEILSCLEQYMHISVSIGVSRITDNIQGINHAYKEAVNALYFKFYTGKSSIINATDVNTDIAKNEIPDLYVEENELAIYVKSGNVEETEQVVNHIFNKLGNDQKYTIKYIQRICDEIVYIVSRAIYELGDDCGCFIFNRNELLGILYKMESISELHEKMKDILKAIAEHCSSKYTQKNKKVIEDIKRLIGKKYMEDININRIADSVHLSASYISVIFKQMTSETILDFLTQTRMENAKTLLRETDFKVLEISEMVGIQDASYFSKVFKKYTGIHPQKFRTFTNSGETKI